MKNSTLMLLVCIIFFNYGCRNDDESMVPGVQNLQQQIDLVYQDFEAEFANGNGPGVAENYTTDGRLFVPGTPSVIGRENIGQFWNGFIQQTGINRVNLSTTLLEVVNETTAIEEGNFELFVNDSRVDFGTYLVVWKLENGEWKLFQDIFNSDQSP